MHFFIVEREWRINTPLKTIISPNTSNQSFEIGILFSVIGRAGNYVFEDDTPPLYKHQGKVVCYALGSYKV